MYNRYIRNDQGEYTRISEEESPLFAPVPPAPPPHPPEKESGDGPGGALRHFLNRFHLESLDTGDLLLLLLLFLLFQEEADEELLIALGLLLIL